MRPLVRDGADDARLAIVPVHGLDARHVAQLGTHTVGRDQQPRRHADAVGEMHRDLVGIHREGLHRHAFDDVDAEPGGATAQSLVECSVGDHVGERLARRDLAGEGQEHRPNRIGRARVGDDHVEDRLRLRLDLVPGVEPRQQPTGRRGDGRGSRILLPDASGRGIDDCDPEPRPRLAHGDRRRQSDIARSGDQHIERAAILS